LKKSDRSSETKRDRSSEGKPRSPFAEQNRDEPSLKKSAIAFLNGNAIAWWKKGRSRV
jgi:hypothetical protein